MMRKKQSGEHNVAAPESDDKAPWLMREPKELDEDEVKSNPIGLVVIAALFIALWVFADVRYVLIIFGILISIFLHELGHFATAKWTGMKATQFFLFMGPRLWSFKRGETEYGIRLLPLGAFVRIIGMNNLDPCDEQDAPRAYMNQSYPKRMLVITAGSIMHFIQAFVLAIVLFAAVGFPDRAGAWEIGEISVLESPDGTEKAAPSSEAGLQLGDSIVSVDGIESANFSDMSTYLRANPGKEVTLEVERNGEIITSSVALASRVTPPEQRSYGALLPENIFTDRTDPDAEYGFLGVGPSFTQRERPGVWEGVTFYGSAFMSIPEGMSRVPEGFSTAVSNIGTRGEVSVDDPEAGRPTSIVGVVKIAGDPDLDWSMPIGMLIMFNIIVGIFNLVPLLPLDGGHAAIATYEAIRSRISNKPYHADANKLVPLTYGVVGVMGILTLIPLILDFTRPIVLVTTQLF